MWVLAYLGRPVSAISQSRAAQIGQNHIRWIFRQYYRAPQGVGWIRTPNLSSMQRCCSSGGRLAQSPILL